MDKVSENSWLDKLKGTEYQLKVWRSTSLMLIVLCLGLGASTLMLATKTLNDFKSERLVLVPALQRKLVVPAQSYISNSFVKAVSNRIVELQEQWSYVTIEDNFKELFSTYYGHRLEQLTRANLTATDRFNYVEKNKIVSTFKIDEKKSEYLWCKKLNRACALVTGKRSIFINNNEPFSEKEVSFFILAQSVWPDENNPFALKIARMKIDDYSSNPYENMKRQLEAAKKGVLEGGRDE